jgi:hypothetical protein
MTQEGPMKFRFPLSTLIIIGGSLAMQDAGAERAAQKSDDPDRLTCEVTRPPGTRLGGIRRCRTQAEWAQYRGEARDVIHRIQAEGATNCRPERNQPC